MPRNGAGVYSLPPGINPVVVGTPIVDTWANPTLSDVAQAVTDSLDRYGRGGMLAAFGVQDGTVGLPGLAFTNEPTTGLYRAGAGILGLSILATEAARLTATGFSPGTDITLSLGLAAKNWSTVFANAVSYGAVATGELVGSPSASTARFGYGSAWTTLLFGTSATERMRIDATGQVGIGAAPASKFHISAVAGTFIQFTDTTNTKQGYINWSNDALIFSRTGPAETMRIDATGQVGIGVTPDSKFHIQGVGGAGAFSSLRIGYNGIADNYYDAGNHYFRGAGGVTERMRIDSSGNVGIGGVALGAAVKLSVYGHTAMQAPATGGVTNYTYDSSAVLAMSIGYDGTGSGLEAMSILTRKAIPVILGTNAIERMRIDASGNVGIGVAPSYKLQVNGKISYSGSIGEGADDTLASSSTQIRLAPSATWQSVALYTAGSERMRIDATGQVGIGAAPASKFHISAVAGTFIQMTDTTNTKNAYLNWSNDALIIYRTGPTESMRIDASGNVGIGTSTIGTRLVVAKSSTNATFSNEVGTVQVQNLSATANNYSGLAFLEANGNYAAYAGAQILTHSSSSTSVVGELIFGTKQSGVGGNPVERLRITSDGRVYGSALHNNAGSMTGTATQYIGSGTYTPTGTTSTNVTAFSGLVGNWIRIGNIVHVSVYGNVTTTASALAASQFYLSLPIASNLAVTGNLVGTYGGGVASANNGSESGTAMADITNDRAQIFFASCTVGAHQFTATFMYEVL